MTPSFASLEMKRWSSNAILASFEVDVNKEPVNV
jgi:hypothetical protein